MGLDKRIQKLEARCAVAQGPKVIIRRILWKDREKPIAWLGRALTPTGWRTVSAGADTSEEEFAGKLWEMAEEKCASHT